MSKIKFIIFDLDGTLVDSRKDIAGAVNFALTTMGLPPKSVNKIKGYIGSGSRTTMVKALGTGKKAPLEKGIKLFRDYYTAHPVDSAFLYPGVKNFLESSRGIKKAVASNKDKDICVKSLKYLGVMDCFDFVIGGDGPANKKPDPQQLLRAMKHVKVAKENTLMVGDMDSDIIAGRRAGVRTCGVTYGFGIVKDIKAAKPDYIIDSIKEINKIIRGQL